MDQVLGTQPSGKSRFLDDVFLESKPRPPVSRRDSLGPPM